MAALVSPQGQVLSRTALPTGAGEGTEAVVSRIIAALRSSLAGAGSVPGVGIACAGLIDGQRGVVITSPNLPGWSEVPLGEKVGQALGVFTLVENDANAAAVGEHRWGAGRGSQHLVYLTVSTGIGGGLVLGGSLYRGAWGTAGEVGHITVEVDGPPCSCGNRGCLEALASGSAIAREARQRLQTGQSTSLEDLAGGDPSRVTAELVHRAALAGDRLAQELVARAGYYLGIGLASLVNLLGPQVIVVGGGVARMGEMLLSPARAEMRRRAYPYLAARVKVVPSLLGEDAGILGVASLIYDRLGGRCPQP